MASAAARATYKVQLSLYKQSRDAGLLSPEQCADADAAIARAETAIRDAQAKSGADHVQMGAAAAAIGLLADDVTVVGVADDVAIPFLLLLAAIAGEIAAQEAARALEAARQAVADAIATLGAIALAAKVGEQIRGHTEQLIIHLARFLGGAVCGRGPDHQRDPERDRPHWWAEIKNFIKMILKHGLSEKQLLRELLKRFTAAELAEIRQALREVAERMGQDPPDFPPTALP